MPNSNYTVTLPLGSAVIDTFLGIKPHPTKCQVLFNIYSV